MYPIGSLSLGNHNTVPNLCRHTLTFTVLEQVNECFHLKMGVFGRMREETCSTHLVLIPRNMPGCVDHSICDILFTSGCFLFAATCKSRRRWYCSGCSSWDIKASSSVRCLLIGWGCFSYTAGNTLNNMALPVEGKIPGMVSISSQAVQTHLLSVQSPLHLLIT